MSCWLKKQFNSDSWMNHSICWEWFSQSTSQTNRSFGFVNTKLFPVCGWLNHFIFLKSFHFHFRDQFCQSFRWLCKSFFSFSQTSHSIQFVNESIMLLGSVNHSDVSVNHFIDFVNKSFSPICQRWKVTNYIYSRYCNWVAFLCTSTF